MGGGNYSSTKRVRSVTRRALAPGRTGGFRGYGFGRKYYGRRLRTMAKLWNPPERKFVTIANVGVATIGTGAVFLMNNIAEGAGVSERVGRKITMTDYLVRMNFVITGAAAPTQTIRVMVIYDSQTNSTTPVLSEILEFATTGTTVAVSALNLNNRDRFKVLNDVIFTMVQGSNTERVHCKLFRKNLKLTTTYDAATGGVASIQNGGLFLVVSGQTNDVASIYDYNGRTRYTDN